MKSILFALALAAAPAAAQTLRLDLAKPTSDVPETMYGVFFEDINFAADGGLYAEMVKNRSFEFPNALTGWTAFGAVTIEDENPCFDRNPHYARITNSGQLARAGLDNEGFRGIAFQKGKNYRGSFYARAPKGGKVRVAVEFITAAGENPCRTELDIAGTDWAKYEFELAPNVSDDHGRLRFVLLEKGTIDIEHLSLFPADTWKGRAGGLRADLVQALFDLHPRVVRFPGGCVVEGNSLATRYQWKNTIGPVENRPLNENRWNYTFKYRAFPDYYQSLGLGFFEFFQLCEDIGAQALPVLSCGLSCQYESNEQVPLDSLRPYVDDALDLIEFANGDADTYWGGIRASMGHPDPFNLTMVAIGNEQWGKVYVERLELFVEALRKAHPEIKIVGSSGPNADGEHYDYLWPEMKRLDVDLVDEHYYMNPDWFLANAGRYDSYDRNAPKVFAGEYAAHDYPSGKANNWKAALAEAAFMTGLERNADVVRIATYAPLFAHAEAWQWNPDLIWFDNTRIMRTPNYYVQQLYALNAGTDVCSLTLDGRALIGQDSLYASAALDAATGEVIIKVANLSPAERQLSLETTGLKKNTALRDGLHYFLASDSPTTVNSFESEPISPRFRPAYAAEGLTLPPLSFSVFRFPVK